MSVEDTERERFEAWARRAFTANVELRRKDFLGSDGFGEYIKPHIEVAWSAWQVARAEGLAQGRADAEQLRAALAELMRVEDKYLPDAAPYEWADAWELARAAIQPKEST